MGSFFRERPCITGLFLFPKIASPISKFVSTSVCEALQVWPLIPMFLLGAFIWPFCGVAVLSLIFSCYIFLSLQRN